MITVSRKILVAGIISVIVVAVVISTLVFFVNFSNAIYVPDDYPTIQEAINHAKDGDTIIVRDGRYVESITVNKSVTLKSENGPARCIIDGGGKGYVVSISANNVTLEGFTITGSGEESMWIFPPTGVGVVSSGNRIISNNISNNDVGIFLYKSKAKNNIIIHNEISGGVWGIWLDSAVNNTIYSNHITNCDILLGKSRNNKILHNTLKNGGICMGGGNVDKLEYWNTHIIENNTVNGKPIYYFKNKIGGKVPDDAGQVILANCTGMLIENLSISNTSIGIELGFSSKNIIRNNTVGNNMIGISLSSSNNNLIISNDISNNLKGIYFENSNNNTISSNNISFNEYGLEILSSNKNTLILNDVIGNGYYGISIFVSKDNVVYLNNFINNNNTNPNLLLSKTLWHSPNPLTYEYNGQTYTNYLGNYWNYYNGSDYDGDGIGDSSYIIDSNNEDDYPLMEPSKNYKILSSIIFRN